MTNQQNDMLPPWEQFPTYQRYTIGWRMGTGEDYLHNWYAFIEKLPNEYGTRLNYLKRHRPAPLSWGNMILAVLYPATKSDQAVGCSQEDTRKLIELGLVEHDVAYHTWLNKQTEIVWPWSWLGSNDPQKAARYRTREFWFFSRQLNTKREMDNLQLDRIPKPWQRCETQLLTGHLGDIDLKQGLFTLSQMFCAGFVKPPWDFGLSLDDFTDSFAMDMGYTDAFRLWIMSAFDDDLLLREMLASTQVSGDWADWVYQQAGFSL